MQFNLHIGYMLMLDSPVWHLAGCGLRPVPRSGLTSQPWNLSEHFDSCSPLWLREG